MRCWLNGCYSRTKKLAAALQRRGWGGVNLRKSHTSFPILSKSLGYPSVLWFAVDLALGIDTSVVLELAAVGSLTGSRHRVPQGADSCVLDPQRCAHQQQHGLPGALHLAPARGPTFFTLMFPGEPQRHAQWDFIFNAFLSFERSRLSAEVQGAAETGTVVIYNERTHKPVHSPVNFPTSFCLFETFSVNIELFFF